MSQKAAFDDANIPVLTEVVQDKPAPAPAEPAAEAQAAQAPEAPQDSAASAASEADDTAVIDFEARSPGRMSDHDWSLLEQRISERVLQQLQDQVDAVLEQRLRDGMANVLQRALDGLSNEIRAGLRETLETIVEGAVAEEVAHQRTHR